VPLYVCASASTPVAAALIMKGLSPGAALVFLLTGPATNAMTLAIVPKIVGKSAAMIYLLSICGVSLALGGLLNILTDHYGFPAIISVHQHDLMPDYVKWAGSISLTAMLIGYYINIFFLTNKVTPMSQQITLNVEGMTCMHCAGNVKKAVEAIAGADANVQVDLANKIVGFTLADPAKLAAVKTQIQAAGYEVL